MLKNTLKNSILPRNKTMTVIALVLMLTALLPFVTLPAADAHDPPYDFVSFAFVVASPNPVGVGQSVAISMWVDRPMPFAAEANDVRRYGYTLTITAPDGTNTTQQWDIIRDSTSIQFYQFTPQEAGEYTLFFQYAGQTYTWSGPYQNDTFQPASASTTLTVQQEPIAPPTDSYPLPTEYWTRPIEGQNTIWSTIASNWLGPFQNGPYNSLRRVQPDGTAPNSPHIMWTKPLDTGGVVGGSNLGVDGNTFYVGRSYNSRWKNPLVMNGILYYELPEGNAANGGGYIAVDLRTGEEIWYNDKIGAYESGLSAPYFGYYYDFESPNQHGVIPQGALFSMDFAQAYNPITGNLWFNVTNVPTPNPLQGFRGGLLDRIDSRGAMIRIVFNSTGRWLAQWNSTNIFGGAGAASFFALSPKSLAAQRQTIDASQSYFYDWNVTVSGLGPGTWYIVYMGSLGGFNGGPMVNVDDIVVLMQTSSGWAPLGGVGWQYANTENFDGANITAISLKPGSRGQILWAKNFPAPSNGATRFVTAWDPEVGVFVTTDSETMQHDGWSLADGSHLWGPVESIYSFDYFNDLLSPFAAYGKLYYSGYGGVVHCWDLETGDPLWTYGNGGAGNSTQTGLETPWGLRPLFIHVIADGKLYLFSDEHSPNSPLYKDALVRCLNATDGTEIWTMMGWGGQSEGGGIPINIVADGFLIYLNLYDMQIYCVGKGPSAMTVNAGPKVSVHGNKVLVEGTVTDIAAGTMQNEQAARFPHGVPAVSDESMSDWMEYVYMQKPRPEDVTGVEVVISVLDPNNNCYEVGRTTSDASGYFKLAFEPEVPGEYTVVATFAGSEAYWPSHAETALYVEDAPQSTPVPTPVPQEPVGTYFTVSTVLIIVAIAIVAFLLLRRR
ncbi:hypothetical protein E2P60_03310 [Candidatus Bathyarchaeota archaeon]|nr:hypothetical protein E2P60_03310 [Candidatus Bathyarchaeota archaeon]